MERPRTRLKLPVLDTLHGRYWNSGLYECCPGLLFQNGRNILPIAYHRACEHVLLLAQDGHLSWSRDPEWLTSARGRIPGRRRNLPYDLGNQGLASRETAASW